MNGRCVWCGALAIQAACKNHELLEPAFWPVMNPDVLHRDKP